MARLFWFLLWPMLAGIIVFWYCWRCDHLKFWTSVWTGLGIAAGVLAFGLAVMVV